MNQPQVQLIGQEGQTNKQAEAVEFLAASDPDVFKAREASPWPQAYVLTAHTL